MFSNLYLSLNVFKMFSRIFHLLYDPTWHNQHGTIGSKTCSWSCRLKGHDHIMYIILIVTTCTKFQLQIHSSVDVVLTREVADSRTAGIFNDIGKDATQIKNLDSTSKSWNKKKMTDNDFFFRFQKHCTCWRRELMVILCKAQCHQEILYAP